MRLKYMYGKLEGLKSHNTSSLSSADQSTTRRKRNYGHLTPIMHGLDPGLRYRIAKAQRFYVTQSI